MGPIKESKNYLPSKHTIENTLKKDTEQSQI
jgi:hypothetical protein